MIRESMFGVWLCPQMLEPADILAVLLALAIFNHVSSSISQHFIPSISERACHDEISSDFFCYILRSLAIMQVRSTLSSTVSSRPQFLALHTTLFQLYFLHNMS